MAMEGTIKQRDEFLEIVLTGSFDVAEAVEKFAHLLNVCRITESNKVLLDYRKLQRLGSVTQKALYAYGIEDHYKKYLELGSPDLQFAYVASERLRYEPGVEIVKKGNFKFELFDDRKKAVAWLTGQPHTSPGVELAGASEI